MALLAHGGPFFSLLALPVLLAGRGVRRRIALGHLAVAGVVGALVLAPWIAYQRLYDPPGNRLIKLHLANVQEIDDRGSLEAIADAYRRLEFRDWLSGRWENAKEQWLVFGKSGRSHPVDWVQWQQFFHHLPAMDFLGLGFVALLVRTRDPVATGLTLGLPQVAGYTLAALAMWIVVMLPPGYAMIHHGSFATTALLFFCAAAYAATLPGALGTVVLGLHLAIFAAFWLPMRTLQQAQAPGTPNGWGLALMVAGFIGFAALLRAWQPEASLPASSARGGGSPETAT